MGSARHCPGSTFISLLWLDKCNPHFTSGHAQFIKMRIMPSMQRLSTHASANYRQVQQSSSTVHQSCLTLLALQRLLAGTSRASFSA